MAFDPIEVLADWVRGADLAAAPPLIGVAGAQGSGKTTLARRAARALGAAHLSLDDIYRTRAERAQAAAEVHPLMGVRGPPGTHDLDLLFEVVDRLRAAGPDDVTPLPAFDKLKDDRLPEMDWPVFHGRPRAILIDGWCLGATAQTAGDLLTPINALERDHDPDGGWRRAVNDALAGPYQAAFARFDHRLFLAAPGFDVVAGWRLEQEAGLMGVPVQAVPPDRRAAIDAFVQHFERITRHMLAGGVRTDVVVPLDPARVSLPPAWSRR
ncbi:MAG: kinase [Brevundimonas sp.]|nr:MAG: kinase [Brevundimonas sp.]